MAELVWHESGHKFFETGVDRGVLYPNNSEGVPWNGIISVEENVSGGDSQPYHFDGIKYLDEIQSEDFQATLEAFTYPEEFDACEGNSSLATGLFVGSQTRETFGLSYRTRLGNDVDGADLGYRLHMIYNLTAEPSAKAYQTIGETLDASTFQWTINGVPVLPGTAPHFPSPPPDPSVWWPDGDDNWETAVPTSLPENPDLPLTGDGEWKQHANTNDWWYFDDVANYYWTNENGIWLRFNEVTGEWRGLNTATDVWVSFDSDGWGIWVWPDNFETFGWPLGPDGDTPVPGWRATAYIWVDSNTVDPNYLSDLEDRLYGTDPADYFGTEFDTFGSPAYLPSQFDVMNILSGRASEIPFGLGDSEPRVYPFGEWVNPDAPPPSGTLGTPIVLTFDSPSTYYAELPSMDLVHDHFTWNPSALEVDVDMMADNSSWGSIATFDLAGFTEDYLVEHPTHTWVSYLAFNGHGRMVETVEASEIPTAEEGYVKVILTLSARSTEEANLGAYVIFGVYESPEDDQSTHVFGNSSPDGRILTEDGIPTGLYVPLTYNIGPNQDPTPYEYREALTLSRITDALVARKVHVLLSPGGNTLSETTPVPGIVDVDVSTIQVTIQPYWF